MRRCVSCEVSVPSVVVSRFLATAELARILGVHRITVQKWIRVGLLKPPKLTIRNGRAVRLWSPAAVREARRLKERKDAERQFWRRIKADAAKLKRPRRRVPRQVK